MDVKDTSPDIERRTESRVEITFPLSANTEMLGTNFKAELIDLSENGAKFRLSEVPGGHIPHGHESSWTVFFPSGDTSTFKATVRWSLRYPEGFVLGVRFSDLADPSLMSMLISVGKTPASN